MATEITSVTFIIKDGIPASVQFSLIANGENFLELADAFEAENKEKIQEKLVV